MMQEEIRETWREAEEEKPRQVDGQAQQTSVEETTRRQEVKRQQMEEPQEEQERRKSQEPSQTIQEKVHSEKEERRRHETGEVLQESMLQKEHQHGDMHATVEQPECPYPRLQQEYSIYISPDLPQVPYVCESVGYSVVENSQQPPAPASLSSVDACNSSVRVDASAAWRGSNALVPGSPDSTAAEAEAGSAKAGQESNAEEAPAAVVQRIHKSLDVDVATASRASSPFERPEQEGYRTPNSLAAGAVANHTSATLATSAVTDANVDLGASLPSPTSALAETPGKYEKHQDKYRREDTDTLALESYDTWDGGGRSRGSSTRRSTNGVRHYSDCSSGGSRSSRLRSRCESSSSARTSCSRSPTVEGSCLNSKEPRMSTGTDTSDRASQPFRRNRARTIQQESLCSGIWRSRNKSKTEKSACGSNVSSRRNDQVDRRTLRAQEDILGSGFIRRSSSDTSSSSRRDSKWKRPRRKFGSRCVAPRGLPAYSVSSSSSTDSSSTDSSSTDSSNTNSGGCTSRSSTSVRSHLVHSRRKAAAAAAARRRMGCGAAATGNETYRTGSNGDTEAMNGDRDEAVRAAVAPDADGLRSVQVSGAASDYEAEFSIGASRSAYCYPLGGPPASSTETTEKSSAAAEGDGAAAPCRAGVRQLQLLQRMYTEELEEDVVQQLTERLQQREETLQQQLVGMQRALKEEQQQKESASEALQAREAEVKQLERALLHARQQLRLRRTEKEELREQVSAMQQLLEQQQERAKQQRLDKEKEWRKKLQQLRKVYQQEVARLTTFDTQVYKRHISVLHPQQQHGIRSQGLQPESQQTRQEKPALTSSREALQQPLPLMQGRFRHHIHTQQQTHQHQGAHRLTNAGASSIAGSEATLSPRDTGKHERASSFPEDSHLRSRDNSSTASSRTSSRETRSSRDNLVCPAGQASLDNERAGRSPSVARSSQSGIGGRSGSNRSTREKISNINRTSKPAHGGRNDSGSRRGDQGRKNLSATELCDDNMEDPADLMQQQSKPSDVCDSNKETKHQQTSGASVGPATAAPPGSPTVSDGVSACKSSPAADVALGWTSNGSSFPASPSSVNSDTPLLEAGFSSGSGPYRCIRRAYGTVGGRTTNGTWRQRHGFAAVTLSKTATTRRGAAGAAAIESLLASALRANSNSCPVISLAEELETHHALEKKLQQQAAAHTAHDHTPPAVALQAESTAAAAAAGQRDAAKASPRRNEESALVAPDSAEVREATESTASLKTSSYGATARADALPLCRPPPITAAVAAGPTATGMPEGDARGMFGITAATAASIQMPQQEGSEAETEQAKLPTCFCKATPLRRCLLHHPLPTDRVFSSSPTSCGLQHGSFAAAASPRREETAAPEEHEEAGEDEPSLCTRQLLFALKILRAFIRPLCHLCIRRHKSQQQHDSSSRMFRGSTEAPRTSVDNIV